jgi:Uma2 family endonuclease
MAPTTHDLGPSATSEPCPTWEIASLYPAQGQWSSQEYLELAGSTNHLIELSEGRLEVLPMPTDLHQRIVAFLYRALFAFAASNQLGQVRFSALPVRLWDGKFREPDILFMLAKHAQRIGDQFWDGADLVMEVVSDSKRTHDTETKRLEYSKSRIPEYWIVDPFEGAITVLVLPEGGNEYVVHGVFEPGMQATSVLLRGFGIDVAAALRGEG